MNPVTQYDLREALRQERFFKDPSASADARHHNRIVRKALTRWLLELRRRKRKGAS